MDKKIVVTIVGRDRPGIVAGITTALANLNANIVKARASSLSDLFLMMLVIDVKEVKVPLSGLLDKLKSEGEKVGVGVSVETGDNYKKEKRLIVLDMDDTVVDTEVINELAKMAGVEKEVKAITAAAMEGKMEFKEALTKRVGLLKGLPVKKIYEFRSRIPIVPGALEVISELKKTGFVTVLMTGSFDIVANYVGKKLGFDYVFANKLMVKNGKLTGEVKGKVLSPESKLELLKKIAKKEHIPLEECAAVGDGANDLLIIKNAGLGIGFNPKKLIKKEADAFVNVKDLKVLLAFVGGGKLREDIKSRL